MRRPPPGARHCPSLLLVCWEPMVLLHATFVHPKKTLREQYKLPQSWWLWCGMLTSV